jgi:hypothetical protein
MFLLGNHKNIYIYTVYIISLQVDQPSRGYQFCPQDSLPGKRCRMESEVFKARDETIGDVLQHGTTSIDMHTCVYNILNIYSTSAEIHIMNMSNKTQGVYIYYYIYIMDEFVCISFISFNLCIVILLVVGRCSRPPAISCLIWLHRWGGA